MDDPLQRHNERLNGLARFVPQLPGPFVYTDEELRTFGIACRYWRPTRAPTNAHSRLMERGGDSDGDASDNWEARWRCLDRAERLEADGRVGL